MQYFINGGGREFDHLLELQKTGWFKDNEISTLLIIPLAIKEDYWQQKWVNPTQLFETTGGPSITSITTYSDRTNAMEKINQADAIYFTGGSQETLIKRLCEELKLLDEIKKSASLKAIGGGSAGMMVLGEQTIFGATAVKSVNQGMNFIDKTIFDSHFTKHNRLDRLKPVIDQLSDFTGIGVDEQTTLILDDNYRPTAIYGEGTVTYYEAGKTTIYDKNNFTA